MCRSIKVLRRPAPRATPQEVEAAALQFVRKVSGFHKPSAANQAAFENAVLEITKVTQDLLATLPEPRPARVRNEGPSDNQPDPAQL